MAERSTALIGVDEIETVRVKLESILGSATAKRKLLAALDEVAAIVKLARSCGINRRILFRPTMSRNAEVCRHVGRIGLQENEQLVRRE